MYSRIILDHDPANELYFVELAIPTFNDTPMAHLKAFKYGPEGQFNTATAALNAAESYAEAAGDMARLVSKGGLDRNAGGFLLRASEAREVDAAAGH